MEACALTLALVPLNAIEPSALGQLREVQLILVGTASAGYFAMFFASEGNVIIRLAFAFDFEPLAICRLAIMLSRKLRAKAWGSVMEQLTGTNVETFETANEAGKITILESIDAEVPYDCTIKITSWGGRFEAKVVSLIG